MGLAPFYRPDWVLAVFVIIWACITRGSGDRLWCSAIMPKLIMTTASKTEVSLVAWGFSDRLTVIFIRMPACLSVLV